jgi:hypothetical protein
MNTARATVAVVLMASAAVLAGCAAAPVAAPTISPTVSPTPTEPALAEPRTALALTCDELFGVNELQPLLVTPVQVRQDESTTPLGVQGATFEQAGASLCVLGGEDRTDGSYDQGLRIEAVPNAAAQFDAHLASTTIPDSARIDTVGDRSVLVCQGSEQFGGGTNYECWADFLVGDFWVNARMSDAADLDSEEAAALVTAVLTTVADRIRASGPPRALWVPPSGADLAVLCSDPMAPAALFDVDPATLSVADTSYVLQGIPLPGCSWAVPDGGSLGVSVLRSGSWAFDEIAASPGANFLKWPNESAPLDVPATDGALISCNDGCYALVSWQGNLVQLGLGDLYDPAIAAPLFQAWGAGLP